MRLITSSRPSPAGTQVSPPSRDRAMPDSVAAAIVGTPGYRAANAARFATGDNGEGVKPCALRNHDAQHAAAYQHLMPGVASVRGAVQAVRAARENGLVVCEAGRCGHHIGEWHARPYPRQRPG